MLTRDYDIFLLKCTVMASAALPMWTHGGLKAGREKEGRAEWRFSSLAAGTHPSTSLVPTAFKVLGIPTNGAMTWIDCCESIAAIPYILLKRIPCKSLRVI